MIMKVGLGWVQKEVVFVCFKILPWYICMETEENNDNSDNFSNTREEN
jgi:hypothetical protein